MPRAFVHFAFFLFIITALSGVWMRAIPFLQNPLGNYENILHGHSHIAILGWAFLGLFIIFLRITWPNLKQKKHAIILTIIIFIVSIVMFGTFLYEGYGLFSIIMSTVHIFVEYWTVYFIYKQLKAQKHLPKIGTRFIKGSLIALVISTLSPFMLGYLGAADLRASPLFEMSVYFFLHFQYNGWLFLCLIGLFVFILHKKRIAFSSTLMTYGFWIYFVSLFPWFMSSILWADIGALGKVIATIGSMGQAIGVFVILLSIKKIWEPMKHTFSKLIIICITGTLLLLLVKSVMELGLISSTLSALVFDTRPVIIGYLHLTLLGFVSLFILTQFQMVDLLAGNKDTIFLGIVIFMFGFVINEGLLFLMGLNTWGNIIPVPYYNELLLVSSIVLFIGISVLWMSLFQKNQKLR